MADHTRRAFMKNGFAGIAGILLNKTLPTIAYPKDVSQGVPFRLEGIVTETLSGEGIGGLEVKFTAPNDTFEYQAFTDSSGAYIFDIVTSVEQVDYTDANTRARIALGVQGLRSRGNGVDFNVLNGTDNVLKLKIFNILGKEVYSGNSNGFGDATISWNGRNNFGNQVADGMYVYRVSNDAGYTVTGKVTMAGHRYAHLGTTGKVQYKKTISGFNAKVNGLYKQSATLGLLSIAGQQAGFDMYNFNNNELNSNNWDERLDVQMITRAEDPDNTGYDLLDHLKWESGGGVTPGDRLVRWPDNGYPLKIFWDRANAPSDQLIDLLRGGEQWWTDAINKYLPANKQRSNWFEEVTSVPEIGIDTNWNFNTGTAQFVPLTVENPDSPNHILTGRMDWNGQSLNANINIPNAAELYAQLGAHELGHTLGFIAHSPKTNHIMSAGYGEQTPIIHVTDFEGLTMANFTQMKTPTEWRFYTK